MSVPVVVTIGLPASGKSTYAQVLVAEAGFTRFNMDDIRAMLGFPSGSDLWTKEKEKFAFDLMLQSIVASVRSGRRTVIDNTHLNRTWANKYKWALRNFDVSWSVFDVTNVSAVTCIERDQARTGSARVGAEVIERLAREHSKAKAKGLVVTEKWLNEPVATEELAMVAEIEPYVAKPGTQKAVLCDLDGTLFKMNGRTPHQYHLVETDLINPAVHDTLALYAAHGYAILLASGRPGFDQRGYDVRAATERALAKAGVFYDHLWMRTGGDYRKDTVVKLELFNEFIRDRFDVRLSLDDRNSVVELYRNEIGLPTWQVADGNF